MTRLVGLTCCLIVSCCTILSSASWGWGQRGHETVEEVALRIMPKSSFTELMLNNLNEVKFLAMVPDLHWKHGSSVPHPLEGQAHFFAFDFYSPRGTAIPDDIHVLIHHFGNEAVLKNGTVPWRVHEIAVVLVDILKQPRVNVKQVLAAAAVLGHYVGDAGNPLHVSRDFDGVEIGRQGLHSFFETKTVNEMSAALPADVFKMAQPMLHQIPDNVNPIEGALALAREGHAEAITLLAAAKKLGLSESLEVASHPIIIKTLANSSSMLAKIWQEAYTLAGSPVLNTKPVGEVGVPDYIEINYIKGETSNIVKGDIDFDAEE